MNTSNGVDSQENQVPNPVPQKPHSYFVKGVSFLLLIIIAYSLGYQSGRKGFIFNPKSFQVINQNEAPASVDYNLLWEAIKTLNEKYIDKPLDQQKILYGAVKGAIDSVGDPYTAFFQPKDLQNFQTQLKGSFSGIGAEVGKKNDAIVIIAPLEETPAKRAGILAGDIIVQVDGQSTAGWSVDQAVEKIRGAKGTKVTLNIYRNGKDKPFDVTMVRDTILVKSVKWKFKEVEDNGRKKTVAIINLSEFGDDSRVLFNQAVNEALAKNSSGIVLDLRNNPGGYLQTAVDIASNWVKAGDLVVSEDHSDGTSEKYKGQGNPRLNGIKTIVLINGGSASAAEILSGALHDHKLAQLLGEKSFGKGSVQELIDLPGNTAVKVTIAKWVTPGGVNLNHNGLDPDIVVKLTEDDINAGKDPQMDAALKEVVK